MGSKTDIRKRESSKERRTQRDEYYSQDEEKLHLPRPLRENKEREALNKLKKVEKELEEARQNRRRGEK